MFFGRYFWKRTKKVIDHQKHHFGLFWRLITFFCAFSKILNKITFVRLLFMKLKQKKNLKKYFLWFLFQNSKMLFLGVNQFFFNFFSSVLSFKTIYTQMLFWSVFLKTHKKTVINRQKWPKWRFWLSITFFLYVIKNTDQKNICAYIVFKAESKSKHREKIFLWGFSSKTKNALFRGSKMVFFKSQISNWYFCVCSKM